MGKKKEVEVIDITGSVPEEIKTVSQPTISSNSLIEEVKSLNVQEEIQTESLTTMPSNSMTEEELKSSIELNLAINSFLSSEITISKEDEKRMIIPTGIDLLDGSLGGGISTGLVQIIGPPGSGKSAMATRIIVSGRRIWKNKFYAVYIDSEESMSIDRLIQLGVNPPITPINDIKMETVFKNIQLLCAFKDKYPQYMEVPWVVVWDSIANTHPEAAETAEDMNSIMGLKARAFSFYLPKWVPKLNKYNLSLVAINQTRDKIEMNKFKTRPDMRFMGEKTIPGGESLKFNSIQIIDLRAYSDIKYETSETPDCYGFPGLKVRTKAVKNKLFCPNIDAEIIFSFERGYSNFWTNYDLLKEYGRIKTPAGWGSLLELPEIKFRPKLVMETYRSNSQFKEIFDKNVKEVIQTEIIDKYKSTKENQIEA